MAGARGAPSRTVLLGNHGVGAGLQQQLHKLRLAPEARAHQRGLTGARVLVVDVDVPAREEGLGTLNILEERILPQDDDGHSPEERKKRRRRSRISCGIILRDSTARITQVMRLAAPSSVITHARDTMKLDCRLLDFFFVVVTTVAVPLVPERRRKRRREQNEGEQDARSKAPHDHSTSAGGGPGLRRSVLEGGGGLSLVCHFVTSRLHRTCVNFGRWKDGRHADN